MFELLPSIIEDIILLSMVITMMRVMRVIAFSSLQCPDGVFIFFPFQ